MNACAALERPGIAEECLVWHYTVAVWLPDILESGVILPANCKPPERPVVWFSTRTDWEPSAVKGTFDDVGEQRTMTYDEMVSVGMVRIGVQPEDAPHDWGAFVRKSFVSARMARSLVKVARRWGSNPGDWRVSFEPVPQSKWKALHVFRDSKWVDETEALGIVGGAA